MLIKPKIHLLYEHGLDQKPFGSAYIRLIRPFTHPKITPHFEVTMGRTYDGQAVDWVVVDRLWCPQVSPELVKQLIGRIRQAKAKLIYTLDDNFLDFPTQGKDWVLTPERREIVETLLTAAYGIVVTTPHLQSRLAPFNPNIVVVPNTLDERLLSVSGLLADQPHWRSLTKTLRYIWTRYRRRPNPRPVIGYMGTWTHDEDMLMILSALQTLWQKYPDRFRLQIVGGLARPETVQALMGLPLELKLPYADEGVYPVFMRWFSHMLNWDIVLAPLQETPFNRGKSDIKFLDYCALGVAGIYSRVPAYESSVKHLQTGYLVENTVQAWTEALETLLTQPNLRQNIAHHAAHYLHHHRTLNAYAQQWVTAWHQFRE